MEEISLTLKSAQVIRLRLLVEYEIKRNEVLRDFLPTTHNFEHCNFEIEKLSEILKLLDY